MNLHSDPNPSPVSPEVARNLRRSHLVEDYGSSTKLKDALVDNIIFTFTDPQRWPMSDEERQNVLRSWYQAAKDIRSMEELGV